MDCRDRAFQIVSQLQEEHGDIVVITCDMDAFGLREFAKSYPGRYINVGPAEQHAINLACGLAMGRMSPFVYGITAFITQRCFEQIKLSMQDMGLPIIILSYGVDDTYWYDGPTHQCLFDKELIGLLPNIEIVEVEQIRDVYERKVPAYVRLKNVV